MHALAIPLKRIVAILPTFTRGAIELDPRAHDLNGQRIEKRAAAAIKQVNDRSGWLMEEESHEDPFEYDPIPMEHAFTVKVTYRYAGRMKPLPYPDD